MKCVTKMYCPQYNDILPCHLISSRLGMLLYIRQGRAVNFTGKRSKNIGFSLKLKLILTDVKTEIIEVEGKSLQLEFLHKLESCENFEILNPPAASLDFADSATLNVVSECPIDSRLELQFNLMFQLSPQNACSLV